MKQTTVNIISELVGSDIPVEYQEEPRGLVGISQFFLLCTGSKAYAKITFNIVTISCEFNEFSNNLLGKSIKVLN